MNNNTTKIDEVKVEGVKNVETTSNTKSFFKKNAGKVAVSTIAVCFALGLAIGCKEGKEKGNVPSTVKISSTPTPKVTAKPTVTVKPTVTPVVTITPTVEPTVTVTPTPVVEERVLTIDKVNELAKKITLANNEIGLQANEYEVRAALIIENLEILKDEIEDYDLDMQLQLATGYIDKVATYNIKNAKDSSKYVRISDLAYNETDKAILANLENEYISLNNPSLTKKEYYNSYSNIVNFYVERENFKINDEELGYQDLTCGGEYLAEKCIWPTFAIAYCSSANITQDMAMDIKTIQTLIFDGSRYMEDIIYFNAECTKDKVMTK